MISQMRDYTDRIKNLNIKIMYCGPMVFDGMQGIAETLKTRLTHDDIPVSAARSIFSVFVEQVTNMLMYSAEKERGSLPEYGVKELTTGMLVLGENENKHFIQTGNIIRRTSMEYIKNKIDYINTLNKQELRQYFKEQLSAADDNPESKGAGLGLIEIARRADTPIEYLFEPLDDELVYYTMYVEIGQERRDK